MTPHISITKHSTARKGQIDRAVRALRHTDVLVGIPQKHNHRKGDPIGNAALTYILTHGSPIRHIPATPIIEPAIEHEPNKRIIKHELSIAAKHLFAGETNDARVSLNRAGIAGMNAVKDWFTNPANNWPPNKPSTIRQKGSDRRNIDTGALRAAMTYVMRDNP